MKALNTHQEDIRALAPVIESVIKDDYLCVIGNGEQITTESELFDKVVNLF